MLSRAEIVWVCYQSGSWGLPGKETATVIECRRSTTFLSSVFLASHEVHLPSINLGNCTHIEQIVQYLGKPRN